eukprot:TRINITY_DN2116_c0_g1_i1.p2 TRINITY_DN2116_c0_g1~~TRINITY_DN2116_c0_g1_i1.p2  ORF type:complete len:206 (+),score=47.47 TRINITY_DN2116_c0_g1_i1:480-1097(+)
MPRSRRPPSTCAASSCTNPISTRALPGSTAKRSTMLAEGRIDRRIAIDRASTAQAPDDRRFSFRDEWGQVVQTFDPVALDMPHDLTCAFVEAFRVHDAGSSISTRFFFSSRRRHTRSVSAFLLNRSSDLGTLHWLRHTFAMVMLTRLQIQARANPALNPLKIVQVLLGHASIATTAIYLRCVELYEPDINESLAWLYGEAINDAG